MMCYLPLEVIPQGFLDLSIAHETTRDSAIGTRSWAGRFYGRPAQQDDKNSNS